MPRTGARVAGTCDGPDGIIEGHLLRGGDDDGAGDRQELAKRQRDVAGAGGEIDDQVIQSGQ